MHLQHNIPLSNLTTIKLGGKAQHFVVATNTEELAEALEYARSENLGTYILGGGSNTIFPDNELKALVIKIDIKGISYKEVNNHIEVNVCAGENWDDFVKDTVERNYAGVECLSGIPGSVGATPIQNVGAYGQEVRESILEVHAIDVASGQAVSFDNAECDFGYRMSRFKGTDKGKYIVTDVVYRLEKGGKPKMAYPELEREAGESATLSDVRETVLKLRKRKSMVVDPGDPNSQSCGSFFINPTLTAQELGALQERVGGDLPHFPAGDLFKVSAGWLIEHAGWEKGYVHDGVGLSTNHALALTNRGGGTAKKLLALAEQIEKSVYDTYGIRLAREPVVVE